MPTEDGHDKPSVAFHNYFAIAPNLIRGIAKFSDWDKVT
jgi:hypothetical protein